MQGAASGVVSETRAAARHAISLLIIAGVGPVKLRGVVHRDNRGPYRRLGPEQRIIRRNGRPRPMIAGSPAPIDAQKTPGCEAAGGQDDCFGGFWEADAPGIVCPGRGTRASANTSGSDFTWRLWAPVKLRTLRSAPNEESLFLLPDRSEERAPRKRSSRLT
jgi:hypothetical protein